MADRREVILNQEHRKFAEENGVSSIYPNEFPKAYKDAAINAMDENGKQMCLDLLEFMTKNKVEIDCDCPIKERFYYKGEWITKEQLFENFL